MIRGDPADETQRLGLVDRSLAVGKPLVGDAKAWERLLEDDRSGGALSAQDDVRDTSAELRDPQLICRREDAAVDEVGTDRLGREELLVTVRPSCRQGRCSLALPDSASYGRERSHER